MRAFNIFGQIGTEYGKLLADNLQYITETGTDMIKVAIMKLPILPLRTPLHNSSILNLTTKI